VQPKLAFKFGHPGDQRAAFCARSSATSKSKPATVTGSSWCGGMLAGGVVNTLTHTTP
jgi:hypothetical protein